jgi:hypothetical protein
MRIKEKKNLFTSFQLPALNEEFHGICDFQMNYNKLFFCENETAKAEIS